MMPLRRYESWCCQHCGSQIGWLGRFLDLWFGCTWRGTCPVARQAIECRERAELARLLRKYGEP